MQIPPSNDVALRFGAAAARNWIHAYGHGSAPAVIAHRGNATRSGTEGNDLVSLRAAASDGRSDAVEFDIQPLGDGSLVVYHDAKLSDGPLVGRALRELRATDLRSYPDIPTLDVFATEADRLGVNLMAEFKGSGYEPLAISTLQHHIAPERLAVWSFSPRALQGVHAIDPSIPVGYIAARGASRPTLADQLDGLGFAPAFVEFNTVSGTDEAFSTARTHGLDVMFGSGQQAVIDSLRGRQDLIGFVANDPVTAGRFVDAAFG